MWSKPCAISLLQKGQQQQVWVSTVSLTENIMLHHTPVLS